MPIPGYLGLGGGETPPISKDPIKNDLYRGDDNSGYLGLGGGDSGVPEDIGATYDFPNHKLEKFDRYLTSSDLGHVENERGLTQPTIQRFERAGIGLASHFTSYLGQTTGQLLGVPAAIVTGDISKITSNPIIEAFDDLKESSDKNFPEYATDAYKRAGIISKIFGAGRAQWWATEATDRAALALAMLAPGMVESEGLGVAGLIGKGLEATKIAKFDGLSDAFKFQKGWTATLSDKAITGLPEQTLRIANQLKSGTQIVGNTIAQSALSGYETEKAVRQYYTEGDGKELHLSPDEIEKKAFAANQATFWQTVPASMLTSVVTLPQIFSNFAGIKHSVGDVIDSQGINKAIETLSPGKQILKNVGKAIGTGIESGPVAENLQVAVSKANEDFYEGKAKTANLGDILTNWVKDFNDPENGQNNIGLGFIQGILESALGGAARAHAIATGKLKTDAQEKAVLQSYVNSALLKYQQNDGTSFNVKEADGITDKLDPATGKPILDTEKATKHLIGMMGALNNTDYKKAGAISGDALMANWADHDALSALTYSLSGLKGGFEHLNNTLDLGYKRTKEVGGKNDFDPNGVEITPEYKLAEQKLLAQKFRKAYTEVQNTRINIPGVEDMSSEDKNAARNMIENVRLALYNAKSDQLFLKKQQERNNTEALDLMNGVSKDVPQVQDRIKDLQAANEYLEQLNKYHTDNYSKLLTPEILKDEFKTYKEYRSQQTNENKTEENGKEETGNAQTKTNEEGLLNKTETPEIKQETTEENPIISEENKTDTVEPDRESLKPSAILKKDTDKVEAIYKDTPGYLYKKDGDIRFRSEKNDIKVADDNTKLSLDELGIKPTKQTTTDIDVAYDGSGMKLNGHPHSFVSPERPLSAIDHDSGGNPMAITMRNDKDGKIHKYSNKVLATEAAYTLILNEAAKQRALKLMSKPEADFVYVKDPVNQQLLNKVYFKDNIYKVVKDKDSTVSTTDILNDFNTHLQKNIQALSDYKKANPSATDTDLRNESRRLIANIRPADAREIINEPSSGEVSTPTKNAGQTIPVKATPEETDQSTNEILSGTNESTETNNVLGPGESPLANPDVLSPVTNEPLSSDETFDVSMDPKYEDNRTLLAKEPQNNLSYIFYDADTKDYKSNNQEFEDFVSNPTNSLKEFCVFI